MLMRQVNMTSLGDDARETLTIVGLERAKERPLEKHLRLRAPHTWTVLCASVDQYLRTTVDSSSQPTPMEIGAVMSQRVLAVAKLDTRKRGVDSAMPSAAIAARLDISERCADNVRNLLANQVPRPEVAKIMAKAARAVEIQTSAVVVDRSVIDDPIALVEARVAIMWQAWSFEPCGTQ